MPEDREGKTLNKWNKVPSLGLAWASSCFKAVHFLVLRSCFHCQFKHKSSWTYFVKWALQAINEGFDLTYSVIFILLIMLFLQRKEVELLW